MITTKAVRHNGDWERPLRVWWREVTKGELLLLVTLCGFGLTLRVAYAHIHPTHLDELDQIVVAGRSFSGILEGASSHLSPPLDYLLTAMGMRMGLESLEGLRILPVLVSTLAIPVQYRLAYALYPSRSIAAVAAVLMAGSGYAIHMAGWVRMYSLFLLLGATTIWAFVRYRQTQSALWLVAWLSSAVALVYTHYFGLLLLMAIGLYTIVVDAVSRTPLRAIWPFWSSCLAIGMLYLPQLPVLFNQMVNRGGVLLYGHSHPASLVIDTVHSFGALNRLAPVALVANTVFVICAITGILYGFRSSRQQHLLLISVGFIPLLVLLTVTALHGPVTTVRNLIFLLPVWCILVALGLSRLAAVAPLGRTVMPLLIGGAMLVPGLLWAFGERPPDMWREAAAELEAVALLSDRIAVVGGQEAHLALVYSGGLEVTEVSRSPASLSAFEQALREAAVNDDRCLWVLVAIAPTWWEEQEQYRVSLALDQWAAPRVLGQQRERPLPGEGLYLACGRDG